MPDHAALSQSQLSLLAYSAPAHLQPIVRGMRDSGLAWLPVQPGQRLRRSFFPRGRSRLVLVGEDRLPDSAPGPGGYDAGTLAAALEDATQILVHAAKPTPHEYMVAVAAALAHGHGAIIETQPQRVTAWVKEIGDRAPHASVTVISPEAGRYHPARGSA